MEKDKKFITKDEAEHVAKLAELVLSDEELLKITSQLDKILSHVAKISKVDTKNVPPTYHTLSISNVYREDIIKESLTKDEALSNAPAQSNGGFLVPKID